MAIPSRAINDSFVNCVHDGGVVSIYLSIDLAVRVSERACDKNSVLICSLETCIAAADVVAIRELN